jgi:hypothetical protein
LRKAANVHIKTAKNNTPQLWLSTSMSGTNISTIIMKKTLNPSSNKTSSILRDTTTYDIKILLPSLKILNC